MLNNKTRLQPRETHIDASRLILFAGGELPEEEAISVEDHLSACVACRSELENIEGSLLEFDAFYKLAYSEKVTPPPNNWRGFSEKLDEALVVKTSEPEVSHGVTTPGVWRSIRRFTGGVSGYGTVNPFVRMLPFGVAAAAALVFVLFLFHWNQKTKVTVAEIIDNTKTAQAKNLEAVSQPVIYQKLRVQRAADDSSPEDKVTFEVWNDITHSRSRESAGKWSLVSAAQALTRNTVSTGGDAPPLLRELKATYAKNDLKWASPISLDEFSQWRNSIDRKDDVLEEVRLETGERAYSLKTEAASVSSERALRSLEIVVRARDWHPIRENLVVEGKAGNRTYEVAELDYKMVSLNELPDGIWGASPTVMDQPHSAAQENNKASAIELMIQLFSRLDRVDSLAEDQIVVERQSDGRITVRGIVPDENRKAVVVSALGSLASNPSIDLNITLASGSTRQQARAGSKPIHAESFEISPANATKNPVLEEYFSNKHLTGPALDEELANFESRAVDHSSKAQQHASILNQVVVQIPSVDDQFLSPEAARQWQALISKHASEVLHEVISLYGELEPIFANTGPPQKPVELPGKEMDLRSEAKLLSDMADKNDRLLWKSLATTSNDATGKQVLIDASFMESLEQEEALAKAIEYRVRPQ